VKAVDVLFPRDRQLGHERGTSVAGNHDEKDNPGRQDLARSVGGVFTRLWEDVVLTSMSNRGLNTQRS